MGIVMNKLMEIGEYCDCLQNWKQYQIGNESQTQSNLFMSENGTNLDDPIDKIFDHEQIDCGLDKQLEQMHQRLKKRKKLKAQYFKQKEKQLKAKQLEQEIKNRQKRQKIQKERELWLREQEIKKLKQIQTEKLRKQLQQKKIKANKKNKRVKDKNASKHDLLQVQIQDNTFSTTDQNGQKETIQQAEVIAEENLIKERAQNQKQAVKQEDSVQKQKQQSSKKKHIKHNKKAKHKRRQQSSSSSQQSRKSSSSGSVESPKYKNVFQQPEYYYQGPKYSAMKDKLHYNEQQVSQLDSGLFSPRKKEQKGQIQIIDLEKINKNELREQVSQMLIKKLKERYGNEQEGIQSYTIPLQSGIKSHRVSTNGNNKNSSTLSSSLIHTNKNKQLVMINGKNKRLDQQQQEIMEFDNINNRVGMNSTIIEKQSNDYFLDQDDKEEYLKEMFFR